MFAKPFYAALFASLCALAGTPAAWAADALYGAAFDLAQRHKLFRPKHKRMRGMPAL